MIEIKKASKHFGSISAVDKVSLEIRERNLFGLIGTNGAGKSTLLRMAAGILRQDGGEILIDGISVYENVRAKEQLFFIADEPYFFANATPKDMLSYYRSCYPDFAEENFLEYLNRFGLETGRKISTFSKGMKKQLALLCGICSNTKYLLCDETFDGLDPVMRQAVKSIFAGEMERREFTPIVASHNLRELEDICDHLGLLHKGGVLLSKDLEEMKCSIQRVQCVWGKEEDENKILSGLTVIKREKRGSLYTYTVRGTREEIQERFRAISPVFFEILPLTLEEMFISETEVAGYDIKKLILN